MAEHSAIAEESEGGGGTFQKLHSPLKNGDDVVYMNGKRVLVAQPLTVVRALTSTGGARVQAVPPTPSEIGASRALQILVKEEPLGEAVPEPRRRSMHLFDEFLKSTNTKVASVEDSLKSMDVEPPIQTAQEATDEVKVPSETAGEPVVEPLTQVPMEGVVGGNVCVAVKEEPVEEPSIQLVEGVIDVKKVCAKKEKPVEEQSVQLMEGVIDVEKVCAKKEEPVEEQSVQPMEGVIDVDMVCVKKEEPVEEQLVQPIEGVIDVDMVCAKKEAVMDEVKVVKKEVKKEVVEERRVPNLEDGEFPEEAGWSLLGRKVEVATSTARGVKRLVDNEIVHFTYSNYSYKNQWIVRISTKRSGEVLV